MTTSEQFSFRELKGPKAEVLAKVESCPKSPKQAKDFLSWIIQSQPFNGVTIDCHAHSAGEGFAMHLTVKKLY